MIYNAIMIGAESPPSATRFGDLAVGTAVPLMYNNAVTNFIVVNQGLPSSAYNSSCDGTWLMAEIIPKTVKCNREKYSGSNVATNINSTFYNAMDARIKSSIKRVTLPYRESDATLSSINAYCFAPSAMELGNFGWDSEYYSSLPQTGSPLAYFTSIASRIGYDSRHNATKWYTRDVRAYLWNVESTGHMTTTYYNNTFGIRPFFVLPSDLEVPE